MLGIVAPILAFGLAGGWIGSRRRGLGAPAGFVAGAFAAVIVLILGLIDTSL
ncbi:hypothetical protein [Muricoccus aerilatus]|uniref:hypothetical protein n=1 Tax=Muricoccus aerilatus TaxID=452982 RepID=UPI0012EC883E|nr:hypothetical protein [Roseomonas aerilata]